jgi:hypothetical protein
LLKANEFLHPIKTYLSSRYPAAVPFSFWINFLGLPLLPLVIVICYGSICGYVLHKKGELVEEGKLRLARSILEKERYEEFKTVYLQKKTFSLDETFASFELLKELKNPEREVILKQGAAIFQKIEGQKIAFGKGSTKIFRPYFYEEKKLEKPVYMDQTDLLSFLKKVENDLYSERNRLGAGALFFTHFKMKRVQESFGSFYLVDARIMEKRGIV